jgi:hypothetical protein
VVVRGKAVVAVAVLIVTGREMWIVWMVVVAVFIIIRVGETANTSMVFDREASLMSGLVLIGESTNVFALRRSNVWYMRVQLVLKS